MNATDLRIQLEGKYERVEAELAKWETAARDLERSDWHLRQAWRDVPAPEMPEEAVVARKATQAQCEAALALVRRLNGARADFEHTLRLRLRGLGLTPHCGAREMAAQLEGELPVEYSERFVEQRLAPAAAVLGFLAVAVGMWALMSEPRAPANYCVQPPPANAAALLFALVLGLVSAVLAMSSMASGVLVTVTQHRLFLNRNVWPLGELRSVTAKRSVSGREFMLSVQARSGAKYELPVIGSSAALLDTLQRQGVPVVRG